MVARYSWLLSSGAIGTYPSYSLHSQVAIISWCLYLSVGFFHPVTVYCYQLSPVLQSSANNKTMNDDYSITLLFLE